MKSTILIAFSLLLAAATLNAQQLLIERGVQVEGLWCFPVHGDADSYYYLPNRGRLGTTEDSLPEFSFLRYVTERPGVEESTSVSTAGGGGVVNFLVLYDTPPGQIAAARDRLAERVGNEAAKLVGPYAFAAGRFLLVSSILLDDGSTGREVLATGTAPILENSRLAFSFNLSPERSKLLLESFKMKTPDISIVFEMDFRGVTQSYDAEVKVDFDEVRNSKQYKAGGSVYFVGADVEVALDKLRKDNAIQITSVGSDAAMESLVNTVYEKLIGLLFDKVEPEKAPEKSAGMLGALGSLLGSDGPLGSRSMTGFGLSAGFTYKNLEVSGSSVLRFKGRSSVTRKHFITFNIGDLFQRYGDRDDVFRDVPLYDPAFNQRDIFVNLDGSLERDFGDMINNVSVRLQKAHTDGSETLREVHFGPHYFTDTTEAVTASYLSAGDSNLAEWLRYAYQATWQFTGGASYVTPWDTTDRAMINLFTPFHRREIALEGDLAALADRGYRAASVKISYPFFDRVRTDTRLVRVTDTLPPAPFSVTLPLGTNEVDYKISLIGPGVPPLSWRGRDGFGLIFYDEPPND